MNIFQVVKENVTARQAAEQYGLKVNKNGMVCCPFHDDRHPSMKVDKGFCCFACGAKGDVITFVADFFHLGHHVGHEFLRPEARLHGHYEHHVALGKVGNGSFRRGFRLQGNGGFAAHSPDLVETGQRVLGLVGF